jgi:hypothetical protein
LAFFQLLLPDSSFFLFLLQSFLLNRCHFLCLPLKPGNVSQSFTQCRDIDLHMCWHILYGCHFHPVLRHCSLVSIFCMPATATSPSSSTRAWQDFYSVVQRQNLNFELCVHQVLYNLCNCGNGLWAKITSLLV